MGPGVDCWHQDMTKNSSNATNFEGKRNIGAVLAHTYVLGARQQLLRLSRALPYVKHDPINGVNTCLYELSSLLEHVNTVIKYLDACGISHDDSQLFHDIRDHIRHDVRENFDIETKLKTRRATALGLNSEMQFQVSFPQDGILVGSTHVKLSRFAAFINFADVAVNKMMSG